MLLKAAQWCKIVLNSYFHVLDLISIGVLFKRKAWNSKIRLLRRLSQENHYQTFFLGHPVDMPLDFTNLCWPKYLRRLIPVWISPRIENVSVPGRFPSRWHPGWRMVRSWTPRPPRGSGWPTQGTSSSGMSRSPMLENTSARYYCYCYCYCYSYV